jgi:hypothetical protein
MSACGDGAEVDPPRVLRAVSTRGQPRRKWRCALSVGLLEAHGKLISGRVAMLEQQNVRAQKVSMGMMRLASI